MKIEKQFKSKPSKIKSFNDSLSKKLDSLVKTLRERGGSSLSAPKAGLNKRIILLKIENDHVVELINPEIIKGNEPDVNYRAVAIKYQDRSGSKQTALLTDAEAVRFKYELGYLNGFLEGPCEHEYEIVHGLQDSYEQCSKCSISKK